MVFDLMRNYLSLQTLVSQIASFMINTTIPFQDSQPQIHSLSCQMQYLCLCGVTSFCGPLSLSSSVVSFSDSGLWNNKTSNFCFDLEKIHTFEHLCVPSLNPSQFYYGLLKMGVVELHTVFNLWINLDLYRDIMVLLLVSIPFPRILIIQFALLASTQQWIVFM